MLSGILAKYKSYLIKANTRDYQGQYNTSVNVKYIKALYYTILQQR